MALILATAVRVVLATRYAYPTFDGTYYMDLAREMVADGEFRFSTFPPGWPILIASILTFLDPTTLGAPMVAAQTANVIMGSLAGLFSFAFARPYVGSRGASLVALGTWFLPLPLRESAGDLSETSYLFFILGAWMVWRKPRPLGAGLIFGAAYLIRPEALLIVVLLLVADARRDRRRATRLALGCGLVFLPYQAFLMSQTGHFMVSSKIGFLDQAIGPQARGDLVANYGRNVAHLIRLGLGNLGLPLAIAALAGLAALARPGRTSQANPLERHWLILLAPLAVYPLFTFRMETRYLLPYLPILLTLAVLGLAWLPKGPIKRLGVFAVLAGVIWASADEVTDLGRSSERFPSMVEAGQWLRQLDHRNVVIADRKPYVSFWGWTQRAPLPEEENLGRLIEWACARRVDYLVVHAAVSASLTPALLPLVTHVPDSLQSAVELAAAFGGRDPRTTTLLYRIRPECLNLPLTHAPR